MVLVRSRRLERRLGLLRGAGFLAREQNVVLQHALQSTAMVGGHQLAGALQLAPAPQGSLAEQFLHAEVTNLQMIGGMSLLHGLAPGLPAYERALELPSRNRFHPLQ